MPPLPAAPPLAVAVAADMITLQDPSSCCSKGSGPLISLRACLNNYTLQACVWQIASQLACGKVSRWVITFSVVWTNSSVPCHLIHTPRQIPFLFFLLAPRLVQRDSKWAGTFVATHNNIHDSRISNYSFLSSCIYRIYKYVDTRY